MTKVAIYCRVDHGSVAYGQFAIEQQKKQLMRYAKINGLRVSGFYSDCGYSGNDFDRPGFQRLQRAWKAGKFDAVIVTKKDRLFRGNRLDAAVLPFQIISLS